MLAYAFHDHTYEARPVPEPVKEATIIYTGGNAKAAGRKVTVRTACRNDGKTILLVRDDAIQAATGIKTGQATLEYEGVTYTQHLHDRLTHDYVFWPVPAGSTRQPDEYQVPLTKKTINAFQQGLNDAAARQARSAT